MMIGCMNLQLIIRPLAFAGLNAQIQPSLFPGQQSYCSRAENVSSRASQSIPAVKLLRQHWQVVQRIGNTKARLAHLAGECVLLSPKPPIQASRFIGPGSYAWVQARYPANCRCAQLLHVKGFPVESKLVNVFVIVLLFTPDLYPK